MKLDQDYQESYSKILSGLFGNHLYTLIYLDYNFVIDHEISREEITRQVYLGFLYSAVIIYSTYEENISFEYITPQTFILNRADPALISSILSNVQTRALLADQNIPYTYIGIITAGIPYIIYEVDSHSIFDIAMIPPALLAFLLYQSILFFTYTISASIINEKSSRVIETLVASSSVTSIVLGKTIALGIIGLIQLLLFGIVATTTFQSFVTADVSFVHNILAELNLTTLNIFIILVYFLLGYLLFAFISAIIGTTSTKPEDLQLAILPISATLLLALATSLFSIVFQDTNIAEFTAMFPVTSAFAMPGRLLAGYASNLEVFTSLLLLVVTIVLVAFVSIRIYAVAILHYGNRLRLKDLFNIALKIK